MNLESHIVMLLNLLPDIDYIQVRPIESLISENPYEKFNIELLNLTNISVSLALKFSPIKTIVFVLDSFIGINCSNNKLYLSIIF